MSALHAPRGRAKSGPNEAEMGPQSKPPMDLRAASDERPSAWVWCFSRLDDVAGHRGQIGGVDPGRPQLGPGRD
jgi:hypothetical protein